MTRDELEYFLGTTYATPAERLAWYQSQIGQDGTDWYNMPGFGEHHNLFSSYDWTETPTSAWSLLPGAEPGTQFRGNIDPATGRLLSVVQEESPRTKWWERLGPALPLLGAAAYWAGPGGGLSGAGGAGAGAGAGWVSGESLASGLATGASEAAIGGAGWVSGESLASGLATGASEAATGAAAAAGGTAMSEGATLLEVLQAAAASEPGLAATLTEAGLYGSEAVNAALISQFTPSMLEQVGNILKDLPSGVKDLLKNTVSRLFSPQMGRLLDNIVTGALPIAQAVLPLAGMYDSMRRLRDAGDTAATGYRDAGSNYLQTALDRGTAVQDDLEKVGTDAADSWKTLGNDLGKDLRALSTDVKSGWDTLGGDVATRWKDAGTDVKGMFDTAATDSRKDWGSIGDKFQGQYNTLGQTGYDDYENLGTYSRSAWDSLGETGKQDYTDYGQTFNQKYRDLGVENNDLLDAVGVRGNALLTGVGNEYEGKFTDLGKDLQGQWGSLGSEYEDKGRGIANQAKAMAGSFTPFAVRNEIGEFGSDGTWKLNKPFQNVSDASREASQKSFDAAKNFNVDTMRQDEFDLMNRIWASQDEKDYLAHEARQRAQGRLGVQSFAGGNSQTFTDPDTGKTYTVGANPLDVVFQKAREQRDLEAFLKADDSAMKRRGEFITQGNEAMKTPLEFAGLGKEMGMLAGDLGTRKFNASNDAARTWGDLAMKSLDYGFTGKGNGINAYGTSATEGLRTGRDAGLEGARWENARDLEGTQAQVQDYRTGLNTEAGATKEGIDFNLAKQGVGITDDVAKRALGTDWDLTQQGIGINTALAADTKGQGMFDTRTGEGINAYADRFDTGLRGQDAAETKGLGESNRLSEKAITDVAELTGKGIEEVRNATNKGIQAYQTLWDNGQEENLNAINRAIQTTYGSEREALKALTQVYNAAASRLGSGMMGSTTPSTPGASIPAAIGNFIKLFTEGGMSEEQATNTIMEITRQSAEEYLQNPDDWTDTDADALMAQILQEAGVDWVSGFDVIS